MKGVGSRAGSGAQPAPCDSRLDLAKWYPGDPHHHSQYSHLDIESLVGLASFLLGVPFFVVNELGLTKELLNAWTGRELGDLDGQGELVDIADHAFGKKKMSWLIMTDHGPDLGLYEGKVRIMFHGFEYARAIQRWRTEKQEISELEDSQKARCMLCAEELGTVLGRGHLLSYGIPEYLYNPPFDASQDGYIAETYAVQGSGAFCFIAHPFASILDRWQKFEKYLDKIDATTVLRGFELLSGKHDDPEKKNSDDVRLIDVWNRHLAEGQQILIIGGTDAHRVEERERDIRTYAYVDTGWGQLGPADHAQLLEALKNGCTVVTKGAVEATGLGKTSPLVIFAVRNERTGQTVGIGGQLNARPGDILDVDVDSNCSNLQLKLLSSIPGAARNTELKKHYEITVPPDYLDTRSYIRLEGHERNGEAVCYTNPVFLNLQIEDNRTLIAEEKKVP